MKILKLLVLGLMLLPTLVNAQQFDNLATITAGTPNRLCFHDDRNIDCSNDAFAVSGTSLGIGTVSPTVPLEVSGTIKASAFKFDLVAGGAGTSASISETDPNVTAFAKTALPTCGAGEVLKGDGTSLSCVTDSAGVVSETDPNVTAFAKAVLPTCGAGEVLKGDGTSLSCVADVDTTIANNWSESGSDVYRAAGSVGVGTNTPATPLDVVGAGRMVDTATVCAAGNIGAVRYNSSTGTFQICLNR